MMGEISDKVYRNQIYAYKVNQYQENKTPKEKCHTITKLDNVLQVNYPLPNKWKIQKGNSPEKKIKKLLLHKKMMMMMMHFQ